MNIRTVITSILTGIFTIAGCDMTSQPFDYAQGKQKIYSPAELKLDPNERYILTPNASSKPQINGAKVFGVRPGSPFLFTIPATGLGSALSATFTLSSSPYSVITAAFICVDPQSGFAALRRDTVYLSERS